jgi:hypothetical protein
VKQDKKMFILRKLTTTLLRHLLPIGVTTLVLFFIELSFALFILIAITLAGEMDDSITPIRFLTILLTYMSYAFLFTALFLFPPTLLLEWLASKFKGLVLAIPAGLILTSAGGLTLAVLWLEKFESPFRLLNDLIGWIGILSFILLIYSIPWSFYWGVLWFGRAGFRSLKLVIGVLISIIIGVFSARHTSKAGHVEIEGNLT